MGRFHSWDNAIDGKLSLIISFVQLQLLLTIIFSFSATEPLDAPTDAFQFNTISESNVLSLYLHHWMLVLSRLGYALPMWGPAISKMSLNYL